MSYSNPRPQNPVSKFIEWRSTDNNFRYYQKNDKGEGEYISIDLPIYFIVLDELNTITGYCEPKKSGIYSNEVKNLSLEPLIVRTFDKSYHIEGLYKDSKGSYPPGYSFAKSVYGMMFWKEEDEIKYEMVNFKLHGAALTAWIDKGFNAERQAIGVTSSREEKKGANTYNVPIFKRFTKPSGEKHEMAIKMDRELQKYFKEYKSFIESQKVEEEVKNTSENEEYLEEVTNATYKEPDLNTEEEGDDLPF